VDAGSAAFSCQPRDHVFKVLPLVASRQNQIGEFIKYKDDEREVNSACLYAIRNADKSFLRKGSVSTFHFRHRALEHRKRCTDGQRRRSLTRPVIGTQLVREWQGIEHRVTVLDGAFEFQGRPFKSLSATARAITGTRWNGWVFFGLKNRRAAT
jgi:hypothetical protein